MYAVVVGSVKVAGTLLVILRRIVTSRPCTWQSRSAGWMESSPLLLDLGFIFASFIACMWVLHCFTRVPARVRVQAVRVWRFRVKQFGVSALGFGV